jgi:hypothetical protein
VREEALLFFGSKSAVAGRCVAHDNSSMTAGDARKLNNSSASENRTTSGNSWKMFSRGPTMNRALP